MKPKRIFRVYQEPGHDEGLIEYTSLISSARQFTAGIHVPGRWRWRLVAANGQIVGGSQENFASRGNALRAAHREASFYAPGMAAVDVAE